MKHMIYNRKQGRYDKDMKHVYRNIFVFLLTAVFLTGCKAVSEPKESSIQRLDDDGYLYYMEYTEDYYGKEVKEALKNGGYIDLGCSAFFTHNPEGEPLMCRNYDYPHRVSKEDRTITGLNIVLHCSHEGKYESVAMADAVWCGEENPLLQKGGPDMKGFDIRLLDIIPYQCMDGINEKGLSVSILRVDIKEGEQPGRYPIGASVILRLLLDDCADVEEAVSYIDTAEITPEDWQGCHLFVTDAEGHYAVIESRNSIVTIIEGDIVTNFYVGSDDMEDSYRNGKLREDAVMITNENGDPAYSAGYGHGYHRFAAIASQLAFYRDTTKDEYYTSMPESAALVILQSVAQNPYTTAAGISMTQYSVIYNNVEKTLEVWPFQNYEKSWTFDVQGNSK